MPRAKPFRLKPPPRLREDDVERACLDLLRYRGYYPVRLQSGLFKTPDGRWTRVGEPGIPDYIAAHGSYPAVFVEVKRPGGALSTEQRDKIGELELWRLAVATVDSVEALLSYLEQHERRPAKL